MIFSVRTEKERAEEIAALKSRIGTAPLGGRSFDLEFRARFLQLWDLCVERGDKTRLLREFGLSGSTVRRWLDARSEGQLTESMLAASRRSKHHMSNEQRAELLRLRKENEELRKKVAQGEAVQDILGKAFGLLEQVNKSPNLEEMRIPPALMSLDQYAQWLEREQLF